VPEAPPVSPGVKNPVSSSSDPPPGKPPLSTFAEIVERPLFAQSRRPAPKKETKVAEAAPKPETFELIGVVISPAGRMALLRTIATSEIVRAVEGQSVGGWEVRAIKPTQVVLQQGNESDVIKLNDAAAPATKNTAVPPGETSPATRQDTTQTQGPAQSSSTAKASPGVPPETTTE
jgi:hypothetical protein